MSQCDEIGDLRAGQARLMVHCCERAGHDGQHMARSGDVTVFWDQASEPSLWGCLFKLVGIALLVGALAHFVLTPVNKWALGCESRGGVVVLIPPGCVQPLK